MLVYPLYLLCVKITDLFQEDFALNEIALYVQGRVIPCDFIGIIKSQQSVYLKGNMDTIT